MSKSRINRIGGWVAVEDSEQDVTSFLVTPLTWAVKNILFDHYGDPMENTSGIGAELGIEFFRHSVKQIKEIDRYGSASDDVEVFDDSDFVEIDYCGKIYKVLKYNAVDTVSYEVVMAVSQKIANMDDVTAADIIDIDYFQKYGYVIADNKITCTKDKSCKCADGFMRLDAPGYNPNVPITRDQFKYLMRGCLWDYIKDHNFVRQMSRLFYYFQEKHLLFDNVMAHNPSWYLDIMAHMAHNKNEIEREEHERMKEEASRARG